MTAMTNMAGTNSSMPIAWCIVIRKEVCNSELIERMMTSRKVEVEVTGDNTAKPFLYIPHPSLIAIGLAIVRAETLYSIAWPREAFSCLRTEENARKGVDISLQGVYLRKSTTTKSHALSLLTAHTSSRSHGVDNSSPIRCEGSLVTPSRNVRPENCRFTSLSSSVQHHLGRFSLHNLSSSP
jgi:hypothetical protein